MLARRTAGVEVPDTRAISSSCSPIHVVAALVCVVTGVLAMTAPKRAGRHPRAGRTYYAGLGVVLITAVAMAALRWPRDLHLLALGGASFALASRGVSAKRRHRPGWRRVHIPAMGAPTSRCSPRSTSTTAAACPSGTGCRTSHTGCCPDSSGCPRYFGRCDGTGCSARDRQR
jgi:hypothetical protein